MDYRVIIHDEVKEELKNIFRYIYKKTLSWKIATNVYEKIYSWINWLDFLPEIYQIYYKDFRVKNILNYRVFYKINKEKKEVRIYYIFWAAQDFSKKL